MHPTWRDLVIEQLAGDAGLCRHFLARCGPHGIALALSMEGGAAGERRLPLIADDQGWDAIGDRIYALVPELDHAEMVLVLGAVRGALEIVTSDGAAAGEARVLARMALARTASLWEAAGTPVSLDCVDAWLALSDRLDPPVSPSFLAPTWAELLPAGLPDPDDLVEVQRFTDWVTLCELLGGFSPEVLAHLGFCAAHDVLIRQFRESIRPHKDLELRTDEPADPTTPTDDDRRRKIADGTVRRVLADL